MRFSQVSLLCALALLTTGCDENRYEVVLEPVAGGLQRVLTCWREDAAKPDKPLRAMDPAELKRIAAAYGTPAPQAEPKKNVFSGVFAEVMPADLNGAGRYAAWHSALGSGAWYSERFGGTDDVEAQVQASFVAADRLVDVLDGWLQTRLGTNPEWPRFHGLLTKDVRRDLHNLVLMAFAADYAKSSGANDGHGDADENLSSRALHYLVEHAYLTKAELPIWYGLLQASSADEGYRTITPVLVSIVARKTALAADSAGLKALRDLLIDPHLLDSLNAFLRTTPEWAKLQAEWQEKRKKDPAAAEPKADKVLDDMRDALLGYVLLWSSGSSGDLHVRLRLALAPTATNGTWNAATRELSWHTAVPAPNRVSYHAWAVWTEPDTAWQTAHFGRVLLQGEPLSEYLIWYACLDKAQATEWDGFLADLKPDAAPAAKIATFIFRQERADGPASDKQLETSAAQPARKLLLDALKPAPRPSPH